MDFNYEMLAEVIREKMGINFKNKIEYLKRKIDPLLKEEGKTIGDLIMNMNKDSKYLQKIIELVTINETYFFREQEQLDAYKQVLRNLAKKKKKIKIWSAACSTGEEPFTLAFIAKDIVGESTEIEIVASDINTDVIEFAEKGVYPKNSLSFRRISDNIVYRYFDEQGDDLKIKKEYLDIVKFQRFNLVDKQKWIMMKNYDIIFCRNVLIYFDDETIKEINENFYNSLAEDGFLFLGHSDPHREIYHSFKVISDRESTYLKKGG